MKEMGWYSFEREDQEMEIESWDSEVSALPLEWRPDPLPDLRGPQVELLFEC